MRGSKFRDNRMPLNGLVAAFCVALMLGSLGCADSQSTDSDEARSSARNDTLRNQALPAVVTEDRPILPDGPPSGRFADSEVGLEFSHHSFLQRSLSPGRGFGTVTLRYGNGRIVITAYDEPVAARNLTNELRLAVERHYRGAVFPSKAPRMTRVGSSQIPQPRTEGPTMEWIVEEPPEVASELEFLEKGDYDLLYTEIRRQSWEEDLFKRSEAWVLETQTWRSFTRETPAGFAFRGLSGVAYVEGQRYMVTLEAASDAPRPVHIVYFYPYEDYPVMREVIATLHETLRVN